MIISSYYHYNINVAVIMEDGGGKTILVTFFTKKVGKVPPIKLFCTSCSVRFTNWIVDTLSGTHRIKKLKF